MGITHHFGTAPRVFVALALLGCADGPCLFGPCPPQIRGEDGGPPPAPSEPLMCDATAADEIAFVYHESDALFGPYLPHGRWFLVVDGSCRYHVASVDAPGVLRFGRITADELAAMNEELLVATWEQYAGQRLGFDMRAADLHTTTLRREDNEVQCYGPCSRVDATLARMSDLARAWIGPLWERGEPVGGPVDLDVRAPRSEIVAPIEWTGTTEIAALAAGAAGARIRIDDAADVARLRALRATARTSVYSGAPIYIIDDATVLGIGVVDALPFDLEFARGRSAPWRD